MNHRPVPLPPRSELPGKRLVSVLRRVAFWAAVVLPLAYIPLLSRPVGKTKLAVLLALVATNVVCLLVGHNYSP